MNIELCLSWYENAARQSILKVGELNVGGFYSIYHSQGTKWRSFTLLPSNGLNPLVEYETYRDHDSAESAANYLLTKTKEWFNLSLAKAKLL